MTPARGVLLGSTTRPTPPIAGTAEPNPALVARYAEACARYRVLYPATREIMCA
jgi:hypothetical protein